ERRRERQEERSRYVDSVLDAEAQRLEGSSGLTLEDLSVLRAAHPNHLDEFMLVRRGWNPSVIMDLDPAEIVVKCEDNRKVSLYELERVKAMEEEALEKSDFYVGKLLKAAEKAEEERQERAAKEEAERVRQKRSDGQIVIDAAALK